MQSVPNPLLIFLFQSWAYPLPHYTFGAILAMSTPVMSMLRQRLDQESGELVRKPETFGEHRRRGLLECLQHEWLSRLRSVSSGSTHRFTSKSKSSRSSDLMKTITQRQKSAITRIFFCCHRRNNAEKRKNDQHPDFVILPLLGKYQFECALLQTGVFKMTKWGSDNDLMNKQFSTSTFSLCRNREPLALSCDIDSIVIKRVSDSRDLQVSVHRAVNFSKHTSCHF